MRAYRVIAAFMHGGQRINPPCEWTPLNQAMADKLVSSGCLKELPDKPAIETRVAKKGGRRRRRK